MAEYLYYEDVDSVLEIIDEVKPGFDHPVTKPKEHTGYDVWFTSTVWFRGAGAGVPRVTIPPKDYSSKEEIVKETQKALEEKRSKLLSERREEKRKRQREEEIERRAEEKASRLNELLEE